MIYLELTGASWRKSSRSGPDEGECVEAAAVWRKSTHSATPEGDCVEVAENWRKSEHSGGNEGSCVEVADGWRKSGHSGGDEGECVEVGRGVARVVAVRDSKDADGHVLAFEVGEWRALLTDIKAGAYDLRA
ncbi:MAG: DUF397 domain-containing protein [Acidimicrobiia bacterium]